MFQNIMVAFWSPIEDYNSPFSKVTEYIISVRDMLVTPPCSIIHDMHQRKGVLGGEVQFAAEKLGDF